MCDRYRLRLLFNLRICSVTEEKFKMNLVYGDITKAEVDAIVNAASTNLMPQPGFAARFIPQQTVSCWNRLVKK